MAQIVVTTGKRFVDIDGLACVIGYAEISNPKPIPVIVGPLNHSITPSIKTWPFSYQTTVPEKELEFVIVDVSEPKEFPNFVDTKKIIEIYDHHFGFEKRWQHLGEKAKIEEIGACATLIWEELEKRNQTQISPVAANLLYTAIISNTLNFNSSLATERDKKAFQELEKYITLPKNWYISYFKDQEKSAFINPENAILNDTKIQIIKGIKCAVAQLELWNSQNFLKENQNRIQAVLSTLETPYWMLISPSLGDGRSYIFTKSETLKNFLRQSLPIYFSSTDIGIIPKLYLRKEILKKIQ